MILFYHLSYSEGPRELFGDLDIKFGKENRERVQRNVIMLDTNLISRIRCPALLQITFALLIFLTKRFASLLFTWIGQRSHQIIIIKISDTGRLRTMKLEFCYAARDHLF